MEKLTRKRLLIGVNELTQQDKSLAAIVERHGPPPLWSRPASFSSLLKIILEQQVSLASADAIYKKLQNRVDTINEQCIVALSESGLRELGFTRQKSHYCYQLAQSIRAGDIQLQKVNRMSDREALEYLTRIKGVGPWTANVYLMMALRRPDIWPDGDLALAESARRAKRLRQRPSYPRLNKMAQQWAPWRSVAARILWHSYLSENKVRA